MLEREYLNLCFIKYSGSYPVTHRLYISRIFEILMRREPNINFEILFLCVCMCVVGGCVP